LKNNKLSVLWHQHSEVPDPYLFRLSVPASVKIAWRFQSLSGGSGLETINRQIKREERISKEYSSDLFTSLG
jgi:hypothetical protein